MRIVVAWVVVVWCAGDRVLAAECSLKGVKSDWVAASISGSLPQGVKVEWRSNYSKAFSDCMNEITLRVSNGGQAPVHVELDRCSVDGARQMGVDVKVAPSQASSQLLAMLKNVPDVKNVACSVRVGRSPAAGTSQGRFKEILEAKPADEKTERSLVLELVGLYLDKVQHKKGASELPVSDRIQNALMEVTELRESSGMSTNTRLRDAEYYLHGFYAGASGDLEHKISMYLVPTYDTIKSLQQRYGVDWMRANPANPNSPPGGAKWALEGFEDGKKIRDTGGTGGVTLPSGPAKNVPN
ncbi:hypothetical protein [Bradyrhizobium sp. LB11.1]|uniref:hypothetical protein n=1 Tax=Bradyrhizobium sp. LB11.1 TaxID=3156326 RepID=UPI0033936D64